MPSSRHSVDALGHAGEEGVGRLVEHAAVERARLHLAARAGPARRSSRRLRPIAASRAATRPVMPPPTTTIDGHGAVARTRSASAPRTAGSSLSTRVRAKASPTSAATRGGLDVEVVEHLEVVAHEALRAHQHAVGPAGGGQVADHVEDVGAAPRLGGAAGRLPGDRPARPAVEPDRLGDGGGRLAQLVGVGVVDEHALGQRVGGEQHLGALGERRPARRARRAARKSR